MTKKSRTHRKAKRLLKRILHTPKMTKIYHDMMRDFLLYGYIDIKKYDEIICG